MVYPASLMRALEQGNFFKIVEGIPPGAEFRGFTICSEKNAIMLTVEHSSFDVIPEGQTIPVFHITIKSMGSRAMRVWERLIEAEENEQRR